MSEAIDAGLSLAITGISEVATLAWSKGDGLIPAIVQDCVSRQVLMLGYMNQVSLEATLTTGLVTFFSRSRQKLWVKGETSGHTLKLEAVRTDCDRDSLLVLAKPQGPTCHRGTTSCFGPGESTAELGFLSELWRTIEERAAAPDAGSSYTRKLLDAGIRRQAQKVGEEGVEVALAAVAQDDTALLGEAADLVYHLMVLLKGRGLAPSQVVQVLQERHAPKI